MVGSEIVPAHWAYLLDGGKCVHGQTPWAAVVASLETCWWFDSWRLDSLSRNRAAGRRRSRWLGRRLPCRWRESAEELAGDVGDGGAASGDFVLGEEEEKAGEEVVDLGGGGEVVEVGGECGGGFGGVRAMAWQVSVAGAEAGILGVTYRRQARPLA